MTKYLLNIGDNILVVASDGVFEYMKNSEIANIVTQYYGVGLAEHAASCVVTEASKRWRQRDQYVDDITCVVVFFDSRLIMKNLPKKSQATKSRLLEDVTSPDNVVLEDENENLSTKVLKGDSSSE